MQNEALGILRLTGEATSASPETSSYDASSESTNKTVAAAFYLTTAPEETKTKHGNLEGEYTYTFLKST